MKLIGIILVFMIMYPGQSKLLKMNTEKEHLIEDFKPDNHLNWQVVNDVVMGGISVSKFEIQEGTGIFSGKVSLENNGGFASVRALLPESVAGNFQRIVIRVKGDGKTYSFRIRTDQNFDGVAYASSFSTKKDVWIEHEFLPDDFSPTFRGRTLIDVPPLKNLQIRQIGFLISDKQSGSFNLLIDWIKVQL